MTIGDIEDRLIAKITASLPYLQAVQGYRGELNKDLSEIVFRPMTVLVSLAKTEDVPGTWGSNRLRHTFDLMVMCRNLRGEEQGRRDEDSGAYRVLDDLRTYLTGASLSNDLEPLEYIQEESIIITKELVVYVSTFSLNQEVDYYV